MQLWRSVCGDKLRRSIVQQVPLSREADITSAFRVVVYAPCRRVFEPAETTYTSCLFRRSPAVRRVDRADGIQLTPRRLGTSGDRRRRISIQRTADVVARRRPRTPRLSRRSRSCWSPVGGISATCRRAGRRRNCAVDGGRRFALCNCRHASRAAFCIRSRLRPRLQRTAATHHSGTRRTFTDVRRQSNDVVVHPYRRRR